MRFVQIATVVLDIMDASATNAFAINVIQLGICPKRWRYAWVRNGVADVGQVLNKVKPGMPFAMRTGHHRLADGSLLRVDRELGRWVGSLYTPDMQVKAQVVGSDADVHTWADSVEKRWRTGSKSSAAAWPTHRAPELTSVAPSFVG
jgi:hypothetical protein